LDESLIDNLLLLLLGEVLPAGGRSGLHYLDVFFPVPELVHEGFLLGMGDAGGVSCT
jgi:hypothetical protein